MPSKAAEAPASSPRELVSARRLAEARSHPHIGAGLVALALVAILLSAPLAAAGTFTVSQEQVVVGTTDGIAGVQAEDGLRETMREVDVAPDLLAYPTVQNLSKGTQVSGAFPADVQSSDGVYVDYREVTTSPVVLQSNPAAIDPSCAWTACDNGRLSDNLYATSAAGGDVAVFKNFTFSVPPATAITRVQVGYEAFDATGNDRLGITISWDGGVSWCPTVTTGGLLGADPNAYAFLDFTSCTGHSWVPSDFGGSIATRITHAAVGPPETIDLDANVVRVTYLPLAYELALQYNWTSVAAGPRHDLRLKGHISDENISVQVLTPPSVWTPRLTFTNTTDQVLTYTLAASEFNAGNVSVRFVDALGPDATPSDLWIDYTDILTTVLAYHLDVVQTVMGISGSSPHLDIEGNISAGGENFNVFVWNFSARSWALKMGSGFTSANQMHSAALFPDEIANGTVRIDYQDVDPTNVVPAALTLDLVRVTTTDAAASLPTILLVGGAVAGIAALALFLFFVVLPRRRSSSDTPAAPPGSRPALRAGVRAEPQAPSPSPEIAVADLQPGGAYLVDQPEPAAALRVLERLTGMGRSGLLVTRKDPLTVTRMFRLRHTKTVWLGDTPGSPGGQALAVSLRAVETSVGDFLRTNPVGVVLIDSVKDLVDGNDFPSVLEFVRRTVATVPRGQQILMVSMGPGVLQGRELKLLAQELEIVRIK